MGVGDWAKPLLENNPNIDEIISCNAPWHNKQNCRYPANSPQTFLEGLLYVLLSKEARAISNKKFTHGIDVLGSRQGAWLLRRAKISSRYGVKGYAGGDNWCHHCIPFRENFKVAEAALGFLKLIGSETVVEPRPEIFLHHHELSTAEGQWGPKNQSKQRIVIAPGGGFPEKCWGDESFTELTKRLLKNTGFSLCILGSGEDRDRVKLEQTTNFKNFCGKLNVRQSAAMVSQSDFVVTNSSLCMHLAGAFKIPSLTLLGDWYDSTKLHHHQWGYPESKILGREISSQKYQLANVEDTINHIENVLSN